MARTPDHIQKNKKTTLSSTQKALLILSLLALVLLLAVAGLFAYIRMGILGQLETVDAFPADDNRPAAQEPEQDRPAAVNFLILGSDSRISGGNPEQWTAGAQRTDAIMLAQLSQKNNTVTVMSIPRDSWVPVEGYGHAKINAAYSYGGPQLAVQTVEQLTGVRIDHFAIVDFKTFEALTDQLGGVSIETVNGKRILNGAQALTFVRERYTLPGGDFDRVKRQQAWMRAIMAKVFSSGTLNSPSDTLSLVQTASEYMAVDDQLGITDMVNLARKGASIRPNNIQFITAPYSGTGTSEDGQSIVVLNEDKLGSLMEAWKKDDVDNYLAEHGADISGLSQVVN